MPFPASAQLAAERLPANTFVTAKAIADANGKVHGEVWGVFSIQPQAGETLAAVNSLQRTGRPAPPQPQGFVTAPQKPHASAESAVAPHAGPWTLPGIDGHGPNVWASGRNWRQHLGNPMDDQGRTGDSTISPSRNASSTDDLWHGLRLQLRLALERRR